MKINVVVWVLSVAAAGCLDWSHWSKPQPGKSHPPKPSGPSSTQIVHVFEAAIEHSPLPAVSQDEKGVEVTFAGGHAVPLTASDPQQIERDLREGTLSLVDLFLAARVIKNDNYRLESATPGAMLDEQVARGVHDLLLQVVRAHAADCKALCAGGTAACGSRRSFGDGAPCEIAGKTKDQISAHFGASWCVADFCPAMREARE